MKVPKQVFWLTEIITAICMLQGLANVSICSLVLRIFGSCYFHSYDAGDFFFETLWRQYFTKSECITIADVVKEEFMNGDDILLWNYIILMESILWVIASGTLFTGSYFGYEKHYTKIAYTWCAVTTLVIIGDVTVGVYLGLDYSTAAQALSGLQYGSTEAYTMDVFRIGTLSMMSLILRGYVLELLNIVFIIIIMMLGVRVADLTAKVEHSIHTHGPLAAYAAQGQEQGNRDDVEPEWRDVTSDARSFDRSDSWHRTRDTEILGPRAFSYLDVDSRVRLTPPPAPVSSPINNTSNHNNIWEYGPPVPAPDYSPNPPRRLKSALKPQRSFHRSNSHNTRKPAVGSARNSAYVDMTRIRSTPPPPAPMPSNVINTSRHNDLWEYVTMIHRYDPRISCPDSYQSTTKL